MMLNNRSNELTVETNNTRSYITNPYNITLKYEIINTRSYTTVAPSTTLELKPNEWLLVSAFVLILLTGVLGNAFVMYVFGYRRRHVGRSTTEWLILLLGITDFLSTICNSSLYLYWTITRHKRWDFGSILCKILPSIGPVLTTASSGVILIFALDRYVAIVHPFRGQLTLSTVARAFTINIVLSTLSYVHYIYYIELTDGTCTLRQPSHLPYGIPNCTLIVLRLTAFTCVFVFSSVQIFLKLRINENRPSVQTKSDCSRKKRAKRESQARATARVLFMVGLVFILLVFPRELFYLIINMSWMTSEKGIAITVPILHLNSWLKVMHTSNCCANVFIYAHMHSRFRRIIIRTLYSCSVWKDDLKFARLGSSLSRFNSMTSKSDRVLLQDERAPNVKDKVSCL